MSANNFSENGYSVLPAHNPEWLLRLRSEVYAITRQLFRNSDTNPESGFNNLHKNLSEMSSGKLNELRMTLIEQLTAECNVKEYVFNAFEPQLISLIGPDVLAQKNCNLVIQAPGDPNPSELHRDAPYNSPYEIVVWVPLVDCLRSKAMYILDEKSTNNAFQRLSSQPDDWIGFERYAKSLASNPAVPFGSALFFHTGCLHGSEVNSENETRVSLNIRYKNLFSPSGLKNQMQYFTPIRTSPLSRLGGRLEAKELLA